MQNYDIYRDIAQRCDGDIYIGVVGPVRTGKSTLIARLMELLVLPNMEESPRKTRMVDELPQSGSGREIMTTQPRFVPSEPVSLQLTDCGSVSVRMVDCVGYMVRGALGAGEEDGAHRKVRTPWMEEEIPFAQAAELGTRKVIEEHSTIGILVTTDGSIADIPRVNYASAEESVVQALKNSGKPFVVVLNSAQPDSEQTRQLQSDLQEKYEVPVLLMDVLHMNEQQMEEILGTLLQEFPLRTVHVQLPDWLETLDRSHPLVQKLLSSLREGAQGLRRVRECRGLLDQFDMEENEELRMLSMELGCGNVELKLDLPQSLFYRVLGESCGAQVRSDAHLMSLMGDLVHAKREYDRIAQALESVRQTGYGLVPPLQEELQLEEPEMIKHNGSFGVRLKASGPSLHLMQVDIATEVNPIMGTERESEELVKRLMGEFESDPGRIWETNMFGKPLSSLVKEGLSNKLMRMPEDVREKMRGTLEKIINEGSGGVICILL